MNFRSLTRGDGVVIAAAVLLFIASFLDVFDIAEAPDSMDMTNAWDSGPLLLSVTLAGIIGAACIIISRALPTTPRVLGLDLGHFGVAFTIFAAWSALGQIFDAPGGLNNMGQGGDDGFDSGVGLILSLIATLVMAVGAVLTLAVPAFKAPLMGAPRPAAPGPYGGQPQGGYGYPGAGAGQPQPGAPYGGQPGQPQGQSFGGQPQPQGGQTPPPAQAQASGDFSPFWFAVPVPRPLYAEDGSPTPIAELAPGTWYLAVEQRGATLVAQTQDGRRGVLQDTTGIQRG
ncbi:hypothetical protein [Streptomyces sp. KN37]|uniref:hypothetical protein n=1 Tax=Streptomyces sp. KN37 TaxID=3090667 RepID=UPI002A75F2BF|nr:hypothetical protein [Streptomyces sp. KN37]WPO74096.1 hypothetical protein R9806_27495 [Streptomyces sp. KN37]